MKKYIALFLFAMFSQGLIGQTVPVTFHLDANNTQYQTVKMSSGPTYNYTDDNGDRIFELTLDLQPGKFDYVVLRDECWGLDPDNPLNNGQNASEQATMTISDPMISYLLPKDNDMMRENRIQANFAYTANNPPLTNTISVKINGISIANPSQYFNATKRQLFIADPPNLVNGTNKVTVAYSTNKGSISRSSTFIYQPIKLLIDTMVYRMDHILGWGRVFQKPYPASVFLKCHDKTYTASVNSEGYFGADIDVLNGENLVKVAYSEADLTNPVDQMTVHAEVRHKWWVELNSNISGSTATIQAVPHDINQSELTFSWSQSEDNPSGLLVSGSSSSLSFTVPTQEGNYEIELHVTKANGDDYVARKMLTTEGTPHFIEVNERAPWMKTMVLYEVETDFIDWPNYNFQKMKQTFQHMKDLGVNAFRITPFVSGGFISWDHFQIRSSYGSIDDLKDMVKTAHQYGLKVLFDVPLSHTAPFHPFILPNFLMKEKAEPYYHFSLWKGNPGESDVVTDPINGRQCVYTNLENTYTQEYFTRLMEYWVEVAGADGFRIDCGEQSLLRSPNYVKELHKRLRNINPNLFILEEGDNRDFPEVNYYNFGDATYDWKLNGWNNNEGFPGIFNGTYSIDQFHELLTTGTPDKGLVMHYINVGYFDYFSKRFGAEQERSGVAIINTTYGLPNIRAGEEVGLARANGMADFSDPKKVMPFYIRLIKARKELLGNYPAIERITQNIPASVYAYTSKSNGKIVLTLVNFSATQTSVTLNLENTVFDNKGKTNWYNVVDDQLTDNRNKSSFVVDLIPWKAKVFALDITKEELYPVANSITLQTVSGNNSIETNGGSLSFMAKIYPENSMDQVVWSLEGDDHLAKLSNGTLTACGCGEGQVTVIARSEKNASIEARKTVQIKNQSSGLITNSTFDQNIDNWFLWSPDCNNRFEWSNGEGHLIYNNGSTCFSQLISTSNMTIKAGKKYRVRFDAKATGNYNINCMIRKNGDGYSALSLEPQFRATTAKQTFEFNFTANTSSSIAQVHFNIGATKAEFWLDNVSMCEIFESDSVNVTFRVDMKNETISPTGVHLNGSFSNWSNAIKMQSSGTVYSCTLKMKKGETIQYKFVNGGSTEWNKYELLDGICAFGNDKNRMVVVPDKDTTLDLVCFGKCVSCENVLPSNAGVITGLVSVCQGQSAVNYTVPAISDATSYIWALPSGATGTSTTNSIAVNYGSSAVSGNITVKGHNTNGDGASASLAITINATPTTPTVGTITQPTCALATGSVVLSGLPATGTWTLTRTPGGTTKSGVGAITSITGLTAGTYTFTVTNAAGCTSIESANMVISAQPATPTTPTIGTITQPTCALSTGSVILSGLPATERWTLTRTPGGTTKTGVGAITSITGLTVGTYTFTVTNAAGCTSVASTNATINIQPATPAKPTITIDGNILHSDAIDGNQWYNQNGLVNGAITQDYTPKTSGDYYVIVSANGCDSNSSNLIHFIATGIGQIETANSVIVYPNPFTNELIIELAENTQNPDFEVINSLGQVVSSGVLFEKTAISTASFSPGIYLVKFKSGDTFEFRKIVKN